jgi:hypothetical protein
MASPPEIQILYLKFFFKKFLPNTDIFSRPTNIVELAADGAFSL